MTMRDLEVSRGRSRPPLVGQVLHGILWSTVEQVGGRLISFFIFALLARLLYPADFGLLALAMVVISFGERFAEQGLSEMIVREPELKPGFLESALVVNFLGSGMLTLLTIVAAHPFSMVLRDRTVQPVLIALSFTFLFIGSSAVPMALLQRRMQFRPLARSALAGAVTGGLSGVVLALLGAGVWSLVSLQIVGSATNTVLLWRAADWKPAVWTGTRFYRYQLRFGASIIGIRIGNFLNRRSDDLFTGVFLGTTALGYYAIAYKVYWTLNQLILGSLKRVAFPAFSQIIASKEPIEERYRQAVTMTILISFPAFAGITLTAEPLVALVFGTQWGPSAAVLKILAPVGMLHAIVYYVDPILVAAGRVNLLLRLEGASGILNVVAFGLASQVDLVTVAWAFLGVNSLLFPVRICILWRVIGIAPRVSLGPALRVLVPTTVMGGGVIAIGALLPSTVVFPLELLAQISSGFLLYALTLAILATTSAAWKKDLEPLKALLSATNPAP